MADSQKHRDEDYIELIKNNFDPFLSAGKRVKVRLTENGKKRDERTISNRPKLIEKETEDIWILEASEFKAEIFFAGFLADVEIIEPESLREKVKGKLEATFMSSTGVDAVATASFLSGVSFLFSIGNLMSV